jgi:type IV pilus assembly protein PilW
VTIAELLASIVVSAMTMAAIYEVTLMQQRVYSVQNQVAEMEQTAEALKAMIVRELDMAGYNPTGTALAACGGGYGIPINNARLRICTDTNGDNDTNDAREDIIYQYDAVNRRVLRVTGGVQTIIPNIEAFSFAYIRADGAAATTSAEIRQVDVTVRARTARADRDWNVNGGFRTFTLDFSVTPKNLGL